MNMNILDDWSRLLLHLSLWDKTVHIAGGAPRDFRTLRPIKDVDVFSDVRAATKIQDTMRALGHRMTDQKGSAYFEHNPEVKMVDYWQRDGELPVNIIYLGTPLDMKANLARFDFGICKIGFDSNGLFATDEFNQDFSNAVFTLRYCTNAIQYTRSMERYERLKEKYEGWPLVVPVEFEQHKKALLDLEELFE